jgi:type II secretory ATPase GspE/PulE/Tfp pilus assembly ATPase PilB-like protein
MGVEKYLLPPVLNLAVAQRLLRRLCASCKIKDVANEAEAKIIGDALAAIPKDIAAKYGTGPYELYRPNAKSPCKECGGKAYKGRIGIFEMIHMTAELEAIILGNLSESALRDEAARQGMVTMFQDGVLKVLDGTCSLQELIEVAQTAGEQEEQAVTS